MRIIFMGTPDFAVPSLDILVQNGYNVVAVITSTDKYGGRGGKKLLQSPVKRYAEEKGIPVLQPKNLKNPDFIDLLKSYNADIQIVVAFRMLPVIVWDMPQMGTYNLHGSLLPKFRGAAPINWAIIKGEEETGVTTFKLKHEIDTGDMILQKSLPIKDEDDAGSIHDQMMELGAEAILETVKLIETGKVTMTPQDPQLVSKAPKIFHEDCQIDFNQPARDVFNFIRGLSPYPGAWTYINDEEVKVYRSETEIMEHNVQPGRVMTDNKKSIKIFCQDGLISIKELKKQGKKKMDTISFLNGNTIVLK